MKRLLHVFSRRRLASLTLSSLGIFALCVAQPPAQAHQAPPVLGSVMQNQARSTALAQFDFTRPEEVARWSALYDIASLASTREGMEIRISGPDPYFGGPPVDLPAGVALWARIRLRSPQAGAMRLFYWNAEQQGASEERVANALATGRGWEEILIALPPMGPGTSFRIDPPGDDGVVTIASMRLEKRLLLPSPRWPQPVAPRPAATTPLQLASGNLSLRHDGRNPMGFSLLLDGRPMANGLTRTLIGAVVNNKPQWTPLGGQNTTTRVAFTGTPERRSLRETTTVRDAGGATWIMVREYSPAARAGSFDVVTSVQVSQRRNTIFLPLLALLPGAGSFGARKNQAVFPGLEYLADEPSSSTLDITTAEHRRQVPDNTKITIPMMAIQADNRFISLIWEPQQNTSAVFDSPDRLFRSGGHVMGMIFPGSNGFDREEGNLLPYSGVELHPNAPYVQRATIVGGGAQSVVPALEDYVARRGLPPLPEAGMNLRGYADLAAHGWLDSKIREDDLVRQALYPGFPPAAAAADAPMLMEWLAQHTSDAALQTRLRQTAPRVLARVAPQNYLFATVSHVTYPVVPLVYGSVTLNAEQASQSARAVLGEFKPDGTIEYKPSPGKTDYARTHFARHVNGITSQRVLAALTLAAFSGDRALIDSAVQKLRALGTLYSNDVPRGAQAWEVPLHTPDILAAANLLDAYLKGYELTGDRHFLDQARYWAWTGVPFVYLIKPSEEPIGLYNTIAVFGATEWIGSWFARPVQWNGLVYSDGLYRLAEYEPDGPWRQIADGITIGGIQHTWKRDDAARQGLLPDFLFPKSQVRDGPAINPGTVQTNAVNLFRQTPLYQMRALRQAELLVHAPGRITPGASSADNATFTVEGWPQQPYFVLITGLRANAAPPRVLVNGQAVALNGANEYSPAAGRLVLQVSRRATINVTLPR